VSQERFPDLEITFLISTEKNIDRESQIVKAGITAGELGPWFPPLRSHWAFVDQIIFLISGEVC